MIAEMHGIACRIGKRKNMQMAQAFGWNGCMDKISWAETHAFALVAKRQQCFHIFRTNRAPGLKIGGMKQFAPDSSGNIFGTAIEKGKILHWTKVSLCGVLCAESKINGETLQQCIGETEDKVFHVEAFQFDPRQCMRKARSTVLSSSIRCNPSFEPSSSCTSTLGYSR